MWCAVPFELARVMRFRLRSIHSFIPRCCLESDANPIQLTCSASNNNNSNYSGVFAVVVVVVLVLTERVRLCVYPGRPLVG